MKNQTFQWGLRLLIVVPLLSLHLSCKETRRDIAHEPEMDARIDDFIEEMSSISDEFPEEVKPLEPNSLEPLRFWMAWKSNALFIDRLQLFMVDSDWGFAKEDYFEVGAGYSLSEFLEDRHDGQHEAPADYRENLEAVLGIRYLVVTDVFYDKPVFVEEEGEKERKSWEKLRASFSGGKATGKIAIYDRKTNTWVGGFRCEAEPPESVDFEVEEEWHFSRDLPYYVRSKTEDTFEAKVFETLKPFLDELNSTSQLAETLPDTAEATSP